jgi:hypothetical protein
VLNVVGVLPPVGESDLFTPLRDEGNDFAQRVIQQVDVGGVVHIGFNLTCMVVKTTPVP